MKKLLIFIGLVIVIVASLFVGCVTSRPYVGHGWTAYDYYDAGIVNLDYHAYDNALFYFDNAERIFLKENNSIGLILTYMSIGDLHYIRYEYDSAINNYLNVIDIDSQYWQAWAFLAVCYSEKKVDTMCIVALDMTILAGEREAADWLKENIEQFIWLEGNEAYDEILAIAMTYWL